MFRTKSGGVALDPASARDTLRQALRTHQPDSPRVYAALDSVANQLGVDLKSYGSIRHVPAARTKNLRNEMYVVYDTLRLLTKDATRARTLFPNGGDRALKTYQSLLEKGTRYIPTCVKIAVALALGLGTMIGWKRIVVTVGEKIGKTHLTYGMGIVFSSRFAAVLSLSVTAALQRVAIDISTLTPPAAVNVARVAGA